MILKHLHTNKIITKIGISASNGNKAIIYWFNKYERIYNQQLRFETIDSYILHLNFIGPVAKRLQTAQKTQGPIHQVRLLSPNTSMFISLVARKQEFKAGAIRQKYYFKMMDMLRLAFWSPEIHGEQFYCDLKETVFQKNNGEATIFKLLLKQENKKRQISQKQVLMRQSFIEQPFSEVNTIGKNNETYKFHIIDPIKQSKRKFEISAQNMRFLQQIIRSNMRKLNGTQTLLKCQRNIEKRNADDIDQFDQRQED